MASDPKYTIGEAAKLVWLTARMAKRGIADDKDVGRVDQSDLERKFNRIVDGARERQDKGK